LFDLLAQTPKLIAFFAAQPIMAVAIVNLDLLDPDMDGRRARLKFAR